MRVVLFLLLLSMGVLAKEWTIKRNPFVVSKVYMDSTGKHYLMPKESYAFLDIIARGVFYKNGVKRVLLDLKERGFVTIEEGESVKIDTADIVSEIRAVSIADSYVLLSINNAEATRYEVK